MLKKICAKLHPAAWVDKDTNAKTNARPEMLIIDGISH